MKNNDPLVGLQNRIDKDIVSDTELYQKIAPIIEAAMDDFVTQTEERFDQLSQSQGELMVNIFGLNNVLVSKEVFTVPELNESIERASAELSKMMAAADKKEKEKNAPTLKV